VHGDRIIARRGEAFGMKWDTVDGNDPEVSFAKLKEVMDYVRTERKPYVLEAYTSRLHGHSSSSGAARVTGESDCVADFGAKLIERGVYTADDIEAIRKKYYDEALAALEQVRKEPDPDPGTIHDHTFA
jgi:2-oxoisovalerate dehydrogenase E1 component alpha subunit